MKNIEDTKGVPYREYLRRRNKPQLAALFKEFFEARYGKPFPMDDKDIAAWGTRDSLAAMCYELYASMHSPHTVHDQIIMLALSVLEKED